MTQSDTATAQRPPDPMQGGQLDIFFLACSTCDLKAHIPTGFTVQTSSDCLEGGCCNYKCNNCVGQLCVGGFIPCTTCGSDCDAICLPTGVDVQFDDLELCDAAIKYVDTVVPGVAKDKVVDVVDRAVRMCPCFSKLPAYLSKFSLADFRTAALAGSGELADCLTTRGLDVKDNLAEQERGELSEAGGDKVIRAPVVGLSLYMSLATAAGGCGATYTTCDTVLTLLLQYFKDSAKVMGDQLADWLEANMGFDAVLGPLGDSLRACQPFVAMRDQLNSCLVGGLLNPQVAAAQAAVRDLDLALGAVERHLLSGQALEQQAKAAVQGVRNMAQTASKSYEQHLLDAVSGIMTGGLNFLDTVNFIGQSQDVVAAMESAQAFANDIPSLQNDLEAVEPAMVRAQQALAALKADTSLFSCQVDGAATLAAIEGPLQAASQVVTRADAAAQGALARLSPTNLQASVSTVNREFEISGDLPCSREGSLSIGPPNIAQTVYYPQIYMCSAALAVPMPNEFIPYIRIKGGNAK
jgi:hypothetical protein